jgi:ATP-dependent exoDNAse (exonuclease V) beta subunit
MAVIRWRYDAMIECAQALGRWQLPQQVRKGSGRFNPGEDTIKVPTMHASKGLEFPVVALIGRCLLRATMRLTQRGCFMWRRRGRRRDW